MFDNYNFTAMVLRTLALVPLTIVFIKHIRLMGGKNYRYTKMLLFVIIAFSISNNIFTVFANFYRGEDGNLLDWMRKTSQVINAVSAFGQAWGWYLLYRDGKE